MWRFNGSRIGVPLEPDADLIFGVVRRLAAAERRELAEVLTRIQYLLYDVTDLVATGEDPETHGVPLNSAARIINSARMMLRATATTAIAERAQIASNYSDRGDSVIQDSLVGHTKRGSYIIPVLVPLPEPEEPDFHQPLLDAGGEHVQFHRAGIEPFERRVVRTFAQSMQAVRDLVVTPDRVPNTDDVHELVYRGVSREFCSGLATILKQRDVETFGANVAWAPAVPAPKTMPSSITIDADARQVVERTAEKLSAQRVDPNRVFSGTIVQFRHEDPDDPFGEISVSTVRRGHPAEIVVRLRLDQYKEAWEWHTQGRAVLIEGVVRRTPGRPLRVDQPVRFHPADEMFLPTQ